MPVTSIRCPHCGKVGKVKKHKIKRQRGAWLCRCYNCGYMWEMDAND